MINTHWLRPGTWPRFRKKVNHNRKLVTEMYVNEYLPTCLRRRFYLFNEGYTLFIHTDVWNLQCVALISGINLTLVEAFSDTSVWCDVTAHIMKWGGGGVKRSGCAPCIKLISICRWASISQYVYWNKTIDGLVGSIQLGSFIWLGRGHPLVSTRHWLLADLLAFFERRAV